MGTLCVSSKEMATKENFKIRKIKNIDFFLH